MKIAIISPFQFRFRRGIEHFAWELARGFAGRGLDTHLLAWDWPEPVNWPGGEPDFRVRRVPYLRFFMGYAAIPFYAGWLARGRFDWVMLFFAGYGEGAAMALVRRLRAQRFGVVFHFPHQLAPHRYDEFERYRLVERADWVVAVSQPVADGVTGRFGLPCGVVGNGVNSEAFKPSAEARTAIRQRLSVDADTPVLVTAAALEERKGIQWVLRAIPELAARFPALQYWVLGEGAFGAELERQLGQNPALARHVRLLGRVDDVAPFLAAADVGCLLSFGEAFPIALLEYMASELPAVTSPHPPFPDLVRPEWGVLVNETDAGSVAAELGALLEQPARRRAMGQAGRRQVLQQHTWDRVVSQYLSLLDKPVATPHE